jgi:hypothetical protein
VCLYTGQFKMAISWGIEGFFVAITDADTGAEEFYATVGDALSNPMVKRGMPMLVDRRSATDNPPLCELQSRAQWISTFLCDNSSPRCAFVVRQRPHRHYGLARAITAYLEFRGITAEIFTEIEDAERWLRNGPERID